MILQAGLAFLNALGVRGMYLEYLAALLGLTLIGLGIYQFRK